MILPNQSMGTLRNAAVVFGRHAGIMPAQARLARLSADDGTCSGSCCGQCTCCAKLGTEKCCDWCAANCPKGGIVAPSTGTIFF